MWHGHPGRTQRLRRPSHGHRSALAPTQRLERSKSVSRLIADTANTNIGSSMAVHRGAAAKPFRQCNRASSERAPYRMANRKPAAPAGRTQSAAPTYAHAATGRPTGLSVTHRNPGTSSLLRPYGHQKWARTYGRPSEPG
jgi:hypothetical protein